MVQVFINNKILRHEKSIKNIMSIILLLLLIISGPYAFALTYQYTIKTNNFAISLIEYEKKLEDRESLLKEQYK